MNDIKVNPKSELFYNIPHEYIINTNDELLIDVYNHIIGDTFDDLIHFLRYNIYEILKRCPWCPLSGNNNLIVLMIFRDLRFLKAFHHIIMNNMINILPDDYNIRAINTIYYYLIYLRSNINISDKHIDLFIDIMKQINPSINIIKSRFNRLHIKEIINLIAVKESLYIRSFDMFIKIIDIMKNCCVNLADSDIRLLIQSLCSDPFSDFFIAVINDVDLYYYSLDYNPYNVKQNKLSLITLEILNGCPYYYIYTVITKYLKYIEKHGLENKLYSIIDSIHIIDFDQMKDIINNHNNKSDQIFKN